MKPYKCLVCEGRGIVSNGFYSFGYEPTSSTSPVTPEVCKSCNGTGIIWEVEEWPNIKVPKGDYTWYSIQQPSKKEEKENG